MRTEWNRHVEEVHSWDGTTITVGYTPTYSWSTGTAYYPDGMPFIGDMVFRGTEEYLSPALHGQPDTWQCQYCGTKHWVEDRELSCRKCGAPRDI